LRKNLIITAFVFYVLLLAHPGPARAGNISGTVTAQGLRTPSNILVYVVNGPTVATDLSKTKFIMDQRNLTFIPHILPILAGSPVQFPNNDSVNHNVFSLSRTKNFNLGSYKQGESKTVVFDKPGIVEVRCDVHAEMLAYIMVMKSPFWAITDDAGRFRMPDPESLQQNGLTGIRDIPAGSYVINTWHEKLASRKKTVAVPKTGEVSVHLDITRGVPGVLYK